MMGRKLGTAQAAKRADVHVQTIRRWIAEGVLRATRPHSRAFYRIDSDDLDEVLSREPGLCPGDVLHIAPE